MNIKYVENLIAWFLLKMKKKTKKMYTHSASASQKREQQHQIDILHRTKLNLFEVHHIKIIPTV